MPGATTAPVSSDPLSRPPGAIGQVHTLVIAWSAEEPGRVGEIAVLPRREAQVLGRGDDEPDEPRVRFFRQRPGVFAPTPPLASAGLSRRQLSLTVQDDGLAVERIGRCPLKVNGAACDGALMKLGDTLHLTRQLVLVFGRRVAAFPRPRYFPSSSWGVFGEADAFGILGESPAAWQLREQIAFVAKSANHCLLVGASGTGKELAARAIHALSGPASRPFVARNAATLPSALVDAELFGNAKNYPNAGMPERPGLVGEADGGTLFLDEIGELAIEQQTHLLRVLDRGGEYQRLGEASTRRSTFRLVGATNRDPASLKHDLLARLTSLIEISPLAARVEDVPLLARHLLFAAASRSPEVAGRFVERDAEDHLRAKFSGSFVDYLLRQPFETNTRQLEAVLWKAMSEAQDDTITAPRDGSAVLPSPPQPPPVVRSGDPSADEVRVALETAGGSVGKAAQALGLSSRFALYRIMKKLGIS